MDFGWSPEEEAFRASVRGWLRENLPPGWGTPANPRPSEPAERVAFARQWQRRLFDGGWAGLSWPREYGGRSFTLMQQLLFHEEYVAARAPDLIDAGVGPGLTGPTLIHHGTEAQKRRFLEPILRGEEIWCQGFSEPGAGSDLAALRTRGRLEGDEIIIDGQKVWTSFARYADWCILLVRTNPDAPKHRGLTFVLVDMGTPGITIRPLVEMTGIAWFNEVFFENVRVPRAMVVGEIDRGWDIAVTTLSHERGSSVPYSRLEGEVRDLLTLAARLAHDGPLAADPLVRQRLAELAIETQILKLSTYRNACSILKRGQPGPEGSALKLLWSELEQRIFDLATELLGPYGGLDERAAQAYDAGVWQYGLLWSRAATIYAGTSEVQRNIISQRVLGLPRA